MILRSIRAGTGRQVVASRSSVFSVCLTDLASFGVIPGRPLGIAISLPVGCMTPNTVHRVTLIEGVGERLHHHGLQVARELVAAALPVGQGRRRIGHRSFAVGNDPFGFFLGSRCER